MVINVERVKAKERYNACTVGEWFAKLEALCETTGDNPFEVFQIYVDYGLRLHAAEPGYVNHDAPIHKGDMTVAISKAKLARRMIEAGVAKEITPDALVPVHWKTPHEFHQSLFDLWIVRSNLEKACKSLGDADVPWPDDEGSYRWELDGEACLPESIGDAPDIWNMVGNSDAEPKSAPEITATVRTQPKTAVRGDTALTRLMRKTYRALCEQGEKPSYLRVIDELLTYDSKCDVSRTVQVIDRLGKRIDWENDNGIETSTTFAEFKKRMTRIRKTTPS